MIIAALLLAQTCCMYDGKCQPFVPIFGCEQPCQLCGTVVTPTPTPAPTPSPMISGVLEWLPDGTNYVESPWITRLGNRLFIGGHAGLCCYMPSNDGFAQDQFWAAVFWDGPFKPTYRGRRLPDFAEADDHEAGGYSPLMIGGRWVMLGARTERSFWGQGNRVRPFWVETPDPVFGELVVHREPLWLPLQEECAMMGDVAPMCQNTIGAGQHGSWITTVDGRVLVFSKDDVGFMSPVFHSTSSIVVYVIDTVTMETKFLYEADFGVGPDGKKWAPSLSDVARGRDGWIYGYGGDKQIFEWYNSTKIIEWITYNEGILWERTGREWAWKPGYAVWDIGVLRDGAGVRIDPTIFVAIQAPLGSWATEGLWRLLWMAEPGAKIPSALFGLEATIISRPRKVIRSK